MRAGLALVAAATASTALAAAISSTTISDTDVSSTVISSTDVSSTVISSTDVSSTDVSTTETSSTISSVTISSTTTSIGATETIVDDSDLTEMCKRILGIKSSSTSTVHESTSTEVSSMDSSYTLSATTTSPTSTDEAIPTETAEIELIKVCKLVLEAASTTSFAFSTSTSLASSSGTVSETSAVSTNSLTDSQYTISSTKTTEYLPSEYSRSGNSQPSETTYGTGVEETIISNGTVSLTLPDDSTSTTSTLEAITNGASESQVDITVADSLTTASTTKSDASSSTTFSMASLTDSVTMPVGGISTTSVAISEATDVTISTETTNSGGDSTVVGSSTATTGTTSTAVLESWKTSGLSVTSVTGDGETRSGVSLTTTDTASATTETSALSSYLSSLEGNESTATDSVAQSTGTYTGTKTGSSATLSATASTVSHSSSESTLSGDEATTTGSVAGSTGSHTNTETSTKSTDIVSGTSTTASRSSGELTSTTGTATGSSGSGTATGTNTESAHTASATSSTGSDSSGTSSGTTGTKSSGSATGSSTQSKASSTGSQASSSTGTKTISAVDKPEETGDAFGPKKDYGGLDVYNLGNLTCQDTASLKGERLWEVMKGDEVYRVFEVAYKGNGATCEECFGMKVSDCKSKSEACKTGLRDQAESGDDKLVRYDRAIAKYTASAQARDFICELDQGACKDSPACSDARGPGSWMLLKSLQVMYLTLQDVYAAVEEARRSLSAFTDTYQKTFAPIPSIREEALMLNIMMTIAGGMLGGIPGVGGIFAGTMAGVAQTVIMDEYYFNQKKPANIDAPLEWFAETIKNRYRDMAESLFRNGSYSSVDKKGEVTEVSLKKLMKKGLLLDQQDDPKDFRPTLAKGFKRVILQQLTLYTWENLEKDDTKHIPFIGFDNMSCEKAKAGGDKTLSKIFPGLKDMDNAVDFDGKCYYLLDATAHVYNHVTQNGNTGAPYTECHVKNPPGGQHKTLKDLGDDFGGFSISDFIIPSVLGWKNNSNRNGYEKAASKGKLQPDPQGAAAVNMKVCDYVGNPSSPGVGCPNLNNYERKGDICKQYDESTGVNLPGEWNDGWCRLGWAQYKKNAGDINPLNAYQMEITITDDKSRKIGYATKQQASSPLEVVDSTLPFNLIVSPGKEDNDPVQFWYSDQMWDSNNSGANQCSTGKWDGPTKTRHGNCGFKCPVPNGDVEPPVSATKDHPLPTKAVEAHGNGVEQFVNTFVTSTTAAAPKATSTEPAKAKYVQGDCVLHVRQWQKNTRDPERNPNNEYMVEVTIKDGNHGNPNRDPVAYSNKILAPREKAISIQGDLLKPLLLTTHQTDKDNIDFQYGDDKWAGTQDKPNTHKCSIGKYDSDHRDMDCLFVC